MVAWNFHDDAQCPRCNHPLEDTAHVLQCQGSDANTVFDASLATLITHMETLDTDPAILSAIVDCIRKWRAGLQPNPTDYEDYLRDSILEQSVIGWKNLIEGLPSRRWQTLQHSYYADNHSRKSSRRWLHSLLTQLHHLAWKQWEHRNEVKHVLSQPRYKRAMKQLDEEILHRHMQGPRALNPGDRYLLNYSITTLMSKTVAYKKQWLLNIIAAQQRRLRIRSGNENLVLKNARTDGLHKYFIHMPR